MQKLKRLTCVPHFDRLIVGTGDDRLAVGREGDGTDEGAVGALVARFELQGT